MILSNRRVETNKLHTEKIVGWQLAVFFIGVLASINSCKAAFQNYFTGDDFVYLNWLKLAFLEPHRLWSVFWSNSLEAQSTHFYRPLLSLSMALDRFIWRDNAIGFHLTNLLFHAICSFFIFVILKGYLKDKKVSDGLWLWPLASATTFFLYPLNPEVVTWVGGRVDCVVSAFLLGATYSYIKQSRTNHLFWNFSTACCFILALCSKEMAIIFPALCVSAEITYAEHRLKFMPLQTLLKAALLKTRVLWAILLIYFLVRRISLGTFVGGYDDTLGINFDIGQLAANWLNSLSAIVVPINLSRVSAHSSWMLLWWLIMVITTLVSLVRLWCLDRESRMVITMLSNSFIICLIPVYKILSVAPDLQSSRLGYLATISFTCLLALGICKIFGSKTIAHAVGIAVVVLVVTCSYWLKENNKSWERAGLASNNIQKVFASLCNSGQTHCVVVGAPDCIDGAYVCRNALQEMHDPKLQVQALSFSQFDKSDLGRASSQCTKPVYYWNQDAITLIKAGTAVKNYGAAELQ